MILTSNNLHAGGRSGVGFNRKQLEVLGVEWPPKKGWLRALVGTEISEEQYAEFLSHRKAGGKPARNHEEKASDFDGLEFANRIYEEHPEEFT